MGTEMQITCPDSTKLSSDVLERLGDALESGGYRVRYTKFSVPERGGELVSGLVVGVASGLLTNVVYEALKRVVRRLRDADRSDYDPTTRIRIQIDMTISDFHERA